MNRFALLLLLSSSLLSGAAAALPDLQITLAETNRGAGLEVPSAGDGANEAVSIGGQMARRTAGGQSRYLYVIVGDPAYAPGPREVYVTAEVFDDRAGYLDLSYDRASEAPNLGTKYSRADPVLMTKCGQWREVVFHLPDLRIGHGQNLGADFRFSARGYAIRRVTVSPNKPAGYDPDAPADAEALRSLRVDRPAGMELTFGNDATPASAALFKALGVSSVESYVDWAGVEPAEGRWDWSKWDKQVATLRTAGLKWVPFLIAGPAYATPLWFQRGPYARVYRCLDHGKDSAVQSLFNPALRPQVERFVRAFATQYGRSGMIESLLLGVTGIYGESIYPAGPEGGWTTRLTGDYHNHAGWWAADPDAAASFRAAMRKKYSTIAALNEAWGLSGSGAALRSFDALEPFRPGKDHADRARADFVEWYQQAMTDWAVFWVRTVRDAFPETEIYLCTGGNGDPMLGADFTAQAKAVAPFRAGVRITNEGSQYDHNFTLTREVATATRIYGTFSGFEPASGVTPAGNVARIYNASASGARQLHCYINNVVDDEFSALDLYRASVRWLAPRKPLVDVAVYVPRETWALEPSREAEFYDLSRKLRDVTDHDYVTRLSVVDGALRDHRVLVLPSSPVLEPAAAEAIGKWVERGGTLIAATRPGERPGSRLYDQAAWHDRLFAGARRCGNLFAPTCDPAPARWQLALGRDEDEEWIFGDWHGGESRSMWPETEGATMRWTGANAGLLLPVRPGADYVLRISASVPGAALKGVAPVVRVNGREVGRIEREGRRDLEYRVATAVAGTSSVARLELAVKTWKPSEKEGSGDTRSLGIAVRQVEWVRDGAETAAVGRASLRHDVDEAALAPLTRMVGRGRTVLLPGLLPDYASIARIVASQLPDGADGRIDRRFATRTDGGVLWLDAEGATISESK